MSDYLKKSSTWIGFAVFIVLITSFRVGSIMLLIKVAAYTLVFFVGGFAIVIAVSFFKDLITGARRSKTAMQNRKLTPDEEKDVVNSAIDALMKTERSFIRIKAERSKDLALWDSKFGGNPYLPKGFNYPKSSEGVLLSLLAQINCEELPDSDLGLPKKGILQFYITADNLMGLDFDRQGTERYLSNDKHRVIYHEDVVKDEKELVTDFSFFHDFDGENFPFVGEFALSFEKETAHMSMNDYRIGKITEPEFLDIVDYDEEAVKKRYSVNIDGTGHKLGGYPYFTQWDPRDGLIPDGEEEFELLFQMDSETISGKWEIIWGDAGVANFFIRPTDLRKRDFSKVLYNWDCS